MVRRCTGTLCGLSHSRRCLPQSALVRLVEGLVVSLIRYCVTVYGTANKIQLSRLQRILNFCARVITGRRKYEHISDVLRQLKWLTAENIHLYHSLTLLNKIRYTSEPESLSHGLIARTEAHRRSTRQSDPFVTTKILTESGRRRFVCSALTAFNKLLTSIRDLQPPLFKEVRKRILSEQYDDHDLP